MKNVGNIVLDPMTRNVATDKPKIITKNVNVSYADKQAIKDVDVNIQDKTVTSFVGPSGCGKSTFLRCLNRMNDTIVDCKVSGTIIYDDKDLNSYDPVYLRSRIGMVFQQPNPFPKSIYENVAYGPRIHGVKSGDVLDEIVERSLRKAVLWDEVQEQLGKSALRLSAGQQQRLCIARAIAVEPEVLLMDEPCSSLDPVATSRIEELILDLKADYTIIIVTHNMQQAARVSDYTGFILMGELVEVGITDGLFTTPHDIRTENYITGRAV